jgi:hypothetical protein
VNRFFESIKYSWKAKGRHGIHSPFVYDLVDNCFQLALSKKQLKTVASKVGTKSTSLKLLTQLSKHLGFGRVLTNLKEIETLQSFLHQQNIQAEVDAFNYQEKKGIEVKSRLIFIECSQFDPSSWENILELIPTLNDHSLIVLSGIRTKHFPLNEWDKLISHSSFHFTADLFHYGLLSKRTFQEKEHFVLRY